jgi:hypothetical protein
MKFLFTTTALLALISITCISFADIVIDGNFDDWKKIPVFIEDPDDIEDNDGDIKSIKVESTKDTLYMLMTVYGTVCPKNDRRYYYHLLVDADNKIDTGFNNSEYEGNKTGVKKPIGVDFYAQVGRRNGADDGITVNFLRANSDDTVSENFKYVASGDSYEAAIPFEMFKPLDNLGDIFKVGSAIAIAAFQEGSANDWEVDWTESATHKVGVPSAVDLCGKLTTTWATLKSR